MAHFLPPAGLDLGRFELSGYEYTIESSRVNSGPLFMDFQS